MSQLDRRLVVVLHVQLDHPRFGQPTRSWLGNPEAGAIVRDVVERELARHFEENPALLDQMLIDLQRKQKAATGRLRPRKRRAVSS
jgi:DNA gyrase/topoisomerase IV subunit B